VFVQGTFKEASVQEKGHVSAVGLQTETAGRALILLGAFVSFVLSVSLWFTGNHEQGIFVGLWVPSILALGGLSTGGAR
jgi:hypothetical protein